MAALERAGVLLNTANFLEAIARHGAAESRRVPDLDSDIVTAVIREVYGQAKLLRDQRAKLMAPAVANNPTKGATNIGDPNLKGAKGK